MKNKRRRAIDRLLNEFVACFAESDTVTMSKDCGEVGQYENALVQKHTTPSIVLNNLYQELPCKFPLIYERLVLNYRWYRSELKVVDTFDGWAGLNTFDIFGNPYGENSEEFRQELFRDKGLVETSLPNKFIQFGSGPNGHYDLICFDTSRLNSAGDCPIVLLDHEEILCNFRIRIIQTIASSFETLVNCVISASAGSQPS